MRRVTGGKHDVVCDVDQSVVRAHAGFPNAALHPERSRFYIHIFNLCADVTAASVRVEYSDIQIAEIRLFRLFKIRQRQIIQGGNFSGNAVVTPKVRAVCH